MIQYKIVPDLCTTRSQTDKHTLYGSITRYNKVNEIIMPIYLLIK